MAQAARAAKSFAAPRRAILHAAKRATERRTGLAISERQTKAIDMKAAGAVPA